MKKFGHCVCPKQWLPDMRLFVYCNDFLVTKRTVYNFKYFETLYLATDVSDFYFDK